MHMKCLNDPGSWHDDVIAKSAKDLPMHDDPQKISLIEAAFKGSPLSLRVSESA